MNTKKNLAVSILGIAIVLGGCAATPQESPQEALEAPAPASPSTGVETSSEAPETPQEGSEATNDISVSVDIPARENEDQSASDVLTVLNSLAVKGRAPKTGYDREMFGPAWADVDRNGCDTRNDILLRDMQDVIFKPGTKDCVVASGTLLDPFSGTEILFQRGQDTSSAVQIDHVVPLSLAWQTGAQQMSDAQRVEFANDPLNLLAVDGPLNGQKSDSDAASWLPPNKAFRCEYVTLQVQVKAKYGLWVTSPEKDAMTRVLNDCGQVSIEAPTPAVPPVEPESPTPSVTDTDPQFKSCKEAVANGYGPYQKDVDPEYAWYRDGDADGTVCE